MGKLRKAILDAAKLRAAAVDEARNALQEHLQPMASRILREVVDDTDEFSIDSEMEDDAVKEIRAVVKDYCKEKEEKLDDDMLEPEEIFNDKNEVMYGGQLARIGKRYGMPEKRIVEIAEEELANNLADKYNFPSLTSHKVRIIFSHFKLDQIAETEQY